MKQGAFPEAIVAADKALAIEPGSEVALEAKEQAQQGIGHE